MTVLGREFQVAGAEQWSARLENAVLDNVSDNRVRNKLYHAEISAEQDASKIVKTSQQMAKIKLAWL